MKSIAVVTDGVSRLEEFLKDNLKLIFGDCVEIKSYNFKKMKDKELIDADVVLVMLYDRALKVKEHVKDASKIIKINRNIKKDEIYRLFCLPEGMDVLVVNDNENTIHETILNLYDIGVSHLNLIPYDGKSDYSNIKVAVTPGEMKLIPDYIDEKIDLGNRYIEASTFVQIMTKLKIDDADITERLIKYTDQIISRHTGLDNRYIDMAIKSDELNSIINLSNTGVAMISQKGKVVICNPSLCRMFNLKSDISGNYIDSIDDEKIREILSMKNAEDEVVEFNNRYLSVNRYDIESFGKKMGTCFCIQEITYIKKLEQKLSKKIREKGQIARYTFDDIKTNSAEMKNTIELGRRIAKSDYTVLVTGESGTGKELMAQSIHNASKRAAQPFVAINCAAMPESLLESELFGYEEGAFTGAAKGGKKGLFEQADNGTIFLDEIGDMPIYLQTRLLRVIQEKQVMRIGGDKVIDVDVRIIAATNKNLVKMIEDDKFRADLYYRINVLPIKIPSLKERENDIIYLLEDFLGNKKVLSSESIEVLKRYKWPGNIRELINVAMYIESMCDSYTVNPSDLPYNIQETFNDYTYELNEIKRRIGYEKSESVLQCLHDAGLMKKSIGRSGVQLCLKEKYIDMTEGEIRRILNIFSELKIITSEPGRRGSKITQKGELILEAIKREIK